MDTALDRVRAGLLSFPSSEDLWLAAAHWPVSERVQSNPHRAWMGLGPDAAIEADVRLDDEGPFPWLAIGPGMVRFSREDWNRKERALERASEARARAVDLDVLLGEAEEREATRVVSAWSAKSRARLVRKIATLDLRPLVEGTVLPCMVTLTMPADWLMFAPSSKEAAYRFRWWAEMWQRKWGVPLKCIWKREFQRRGAPHWHLWLVPPTTDLVRFRKWVSASWSRVLFTHRAVSGPLRPNEFRKHLRAGTGVDIAEGIRARDPKRLAVYFLKESLGGDRKAYQNEAPAEWAGGSVGRFWGVRGIPEAVELVPLDPSSAHRVWRVLRKVRESTAGARVVYVPRGVHPVTGEVRYRRVTRRKRIRQGAGWVAVNNGAAFAAQLAQVVAPKGPGFGAWYASTVRSAAALPVS